MKKILAFLFAVVIAFSLVNPAFAEETIPQTNETSETAVLYRPDPIRNIQIDSQGAVLFNPETGITLFSKAPDVKMYPASTTKIMTALVVLENTQNLRNDIITIEDTSIIQYIKDDDGMHMNMLPGESFCAYDLIVGMMVNSYCDAAELLAYYYGGGSVQNFIEMMNEKANEIGCKNTNFSNPHGLHQNDHYSTPEDMALIMCEAIKNPEFLEILKIRNYTFPETNLSGPREVKHTVSIYNEGHKYYHDSFIGGKSGFTDQAGRCLVTYANKGGVSYVLVLFGANLDELKSYPESNMTWRETNMLISYAYENFDVVKYASANEKIASVKVIDSETELDIISKNDIYTLTRKSEDVQMEMSVPESISIEQVSDKNKLGFITVHFDEDKSGYENDLLLSWDGTKIKIKSQLEKSTDEAVENIKTLFSENKKFSVLLIILIAVIALIFPCIKILQILRDKESHKPKH